MSKKQNSGRFILDFKNVSSRISKKKTSEIKKLFLFSLLNAFGCICIANIQLILND